jgi:hypothetical protein
MLGSWCSSHGSLLYCVHLVLGEPLQCGSEGAPQFCVGEWTRGCQFSIEPIDFSLFPAQFPIFGSELLLHLLQSPT